MRREQSDHEEEEDSAIKGPKGAKRKFEEFECPSCSAHNPYTDFGNGDDVNCGYCGQGFVVEVTSDGELELRES